jgi:hypothetical protein
MKSTGATKVLRSCRQITPDITSFRSPSACRPQQLLRRPPVGALCRATTCTLGRLPTHCFHAMQIAKPGAGKRSAGWIPEFGCGGGGTARRRCLQLRFVPLAGCKLGTQGAQRAQSENAGRRRGPRPRGLIRKHDRRTWSPQRADRRPPCVCTRSARCVPARPGEVLPSLAPASQTIYNARVSASQCNGRGLLKLGQVKHVLSLQAENRTLGRSVTQTERTLVTAFRGRGNSHLLALRVWLWTPHRPCARGRLSRSS